MLSRFPLVAGHNDLAWELRQAGSENLSQTNLASPVEFTHTDLPRIAAGGLGAQFWSVSVPATLQGGGALAATLEQVDLVRRMVRHYSGVLELPLSAADGDRTFAAGKVASPFGAEGGLSIASSMGVLRALYAVGVRY